MRLAEPFRISRGTQTQAQNILVTIRDGEYTGIGECAPKSYYGETVGSAMAAIETLIPHISTAPLYIEDIDRQMEQILRFNPSVKAAINTALFDLLGKRLGAPLYTLWGLNPLRAPQTSITIPLNTPAEMARRAAQLQHWPILKIKLGAEDDLEIVKAVRSAAPNAQLRVDANAAWNVHQATAMCKKLAEYHIELIEQPIPPGNNAGLRFIREHSAIPIFADESCVTVQDIPALAESVDGINIKLMKCGGLSHALKMIHTARALHMQVMLGCMIESSLAITAMAHAAPLADKIDLDGALLLAEDPFKGCVIQQGTIHMSDTPGLGVV